MKTTTKRDIDYVTRFFKNRRYKEIEEQQLLHKVPSHMRGELRELLRTSANKRKVITGRMKDGKRLYRLAMT